MAFEKELAALSAGILHGLDAMKFGSFSERNSHLGKMRRCPFCGKRRREFRPLGEECCNASHVRIVDDFPKSLRRKFQHKKHSNKHLLQIREMTLKMQEDENLVSLGARQMNTNLPAISAIPSFAEKYYRWKLEQTARFVRKQQKTSRKINRKNSLTNKPKILHNNPVSEYWRPARVGVKNTSNSSLNGQAPNSQQTSLSEK